MLKLKFGRIQISQISIFVAQADLVYYAKALDSDPIALVCHDMHLTTDAQKIAAGKGIQQIYGGGFQQALWKVVKVLVFI